jgi:NADPH:quinone reductase-like Zn-dependent oxidoreductase
MIWSTGPYPRTPMSDGAGSVVDIGDDVDHVAIGDQVVGAFHPDWQDGRPTVAVKRALPGDTCDGWLQQYMLFPAVAGGVSLYAGQLAKAAGATVMRKPQARRSF